MGVLTVAGLAVLLEDVEHVILELEGAATGAGVGEVLAAARRSERVVTIVGGGGVGSVGAAVEGYAAERGCSVDEARRVSAFVGGSEVGLREAEVAGVRCVGGGGMDMWGLAEALNERWDAQWCATRQFCC